MLEIAAGIGQHAVAFASGPARPANWTPSDPSAGRARQHRRLAANAGRRNLLAAVGASTLPIQQTWPEGPFDAVVCINMIHISPWAATEGLMALAPPACCAARRTPVTSTARIARPRFRWRPSNEAFDASLKARDPAWGLRDRDEVVALARSHGLTLTLRRKCPPTTSAFCSET